jgi:hypothetical protein
VRAGSCFVPHGRIIDDGELAGNALETSLDVELRVDLIRYPLPEASAEDGSETDTCIEAR